MAISTYAELQAAVAAWLERADLTARIPEFVALAEASMNRSLRTRRMTGRSTATISDAYSAVPGDYLEARELSMTDGATTWALDPAPPEVVSDYAVETATGRPRFWSVVGDQIAYWPAPDQAYTATLLYFGRIPALSDSNPSNWVLSEHPDAYLYGALLQSAPFLRDSEALQIFTAGYVAAIQAIKDAERTRAGALRVEPGLAVPQRYNIMTDI